MSLAERFPVGSRWRDSVNFEHIVLGVHGNRVQTASSLEHADWDIDWWADGEMSDWQPWDSSTPHDIYDSGISGPDDEAYEGNEALARRFPSGNKAP